MQRETRPGPAPADQNDPIARQTEVIRALSAKAAANPNDPELRERLKEAYERIDVLVRRRDGWSDDGRPPAQAKQT